LGLDYGDGRGWVDSHFGVGYDVDMTVQDIETPTPDSELATIDVMVSIPALTAFDLKHAANGKLDVAAAASMVLQLYATAPLDRSAVTLMTEQHGRVCAYLGRSPQNTEELVAGIEESLRISLAGVKVKLTAEEVGIMNARNATGLTVKEYAAQVFREMFDAWRDGRI